MAIQKTIKNKYTRKKLAVKTKKVAKFSKPNKFTKANKTDKFKKRRAKKPNRIQLLRRLNAIKKVKPPALPLNVDFYRSAEGIYTSYWLGKLINTLQVNGKKKVVSKHIYRSFSQIKFTTNTSPILLYLETLDKIKPSFRLRNYIVRRVIIKEFPIVALRPRRLILAVHWLKDDIRQGSGKFATPLSTEIASKLLDFKNNPKKNNLVKKRNEFTQRIIKAQFNIRYNFKK